MADHEETPARISGIRVLLLGVPPLFAPGLRSALERPDAVTVAAGATAGEARSAIEDGLVDVCIVDLDQEDGAELLNVALESGDVRHASVIVLTERLGLLGLSEAINRGVSGVVLKTQTPDILRKAVVRVHAGELWLNRDMTAGVLGQLRPVHRGPGAPGAPRQVLTKREREIVALVGRGWRNSEIAQSLYISDVTVRNHLTSIFRKLSLSSRVELAAHAYRHGLASLPTRATRRARVTTLAQRPADAAGQKA